MAVSESDIEAFVAFVREQTSSGECAPSIADFAQQWEAQRQREEVNVAVREGLADIEAGRTRPASEFVAEVKQVM
jgi:predicted transcriptional regulator